MTTAVDGKPKPLRIEREAIQILGPRPANVQVYVEGRELLPSEFKVTDDGCIVLLVDPRDERSDNH